MFTWMGDVLGEIPHVSCPDCVGRGRDTPEALVKINVL